jgi:hypothetical protein
LILTAAKPFDTEAISESHESDGISDGRVVATASPEPPGVVAQTHSVNDDAEVFVKLATATHTCFPAERPEISNDVCPAAVLYGHFDVEVPPGTGASERCNTNPSSSDDTSDQRTRKTPLPTELIDTPCGETGRLEEILGNTEEVVVRPG